MKRAINHVTDQLVPLDDDKKTDSLTITADQDLGLRAGGFFPVCLFTIHRLLHRCMKFPARRASLDVATARLSQMHKDPSRDAIETIQVRAVQNTMKQQAREEGPGASEALSAMEAPV